MIIEECTVTKYTIDIKELSESVTFFSQNKGVGRGEFTIQYAGGCYSYFWGATGEDDILTFIQDAPVGYLVRALMPTQYEEVDLEAMVFAAKDTACRIRRWGTQYMSRELARKLFDMTCWENYLTGWSEHPINNPFKLASLEQEFEDSDFVANIEIPMKKTQKHKEAELIISTIQSEIKKIKKEEK